jgi:hypothetical protein
VSGLHQSAWFEQAALSQRTQGRAPLTACIDDQARRESKAFRWDDTGLVFILELVVPREECIRGSEARKLFPVDRVE